jgi:hypothetical protein
VIAFFVAGSTAFSYGAARAGTLSAGNTPATPGVAGRDVTVTWAQNSPAFLGGLLGADANGGYLIERYAASGAAITPAASCGGLRQGAADPLSCTENSLPTGRWQYTVTPKYYNWLGAEGSKSASAAIAPANPTSVSLVNGAGTGNAFINTANASSLNFDVVVPATSLSSDTITLTLTDPGSVHTVIATQAATTGAGTVHFTGVNGSTLNNGTITIVAKATSSYGDNSASSPSLTRTKDTVAPTNALTLTAKSPGGSSFLSSSTVYYRGTGGGSGGSFKIRNTVTDTGGSGPASSTTAALGGTTTGWTHTPSTVSTPSGGPYDSADFSWAEGASSSPTEVVTGADAAGNTTAAPTLTFTNDSTGPSGGSVSYTNGYLTIATVSVSFTPGTDGGSGIDNASRVLQRASATLLNGTCGSFGTFSTIATNPTSPVTDSSVASGNCYQYQYVVPDNVGNSTAYTSAGVARIDTGKPTNSLSLGTSPPPVGAFRSGTTLYFKSDAAGSFKLANAVTDSESGPASATFPAIATTGWTHGAETVSSGTGSAPTITYTSSTYSWTSGASTPSGSPATFTSKDVATNTSNNTVLAFTSDTTGPSGGSVTVPSFTNSTTVSVTFSAGTDGGAGVNAASGQLSRAQGIYTPSTATCSGFGSFSNIGSPGPTSPFSNTVPTANACYQYRYTVSDNVSNSTTYTSGSVAVDTTAPTATNVTLNNVSGGTTGVAEKGDSVVVTFNEVMDASSFCSNWVNDGSTQMKSGTGDGVSITITDAGASDVLSSVTASGCTFHFGSVALNANYVTATAVFSGNGSSASAVSWNPSTRQLTITFGALNSGTVNATPQAASTPSYTADTALKDQAGNAIGAGPFVGTSSRF